MLRVWAIEASVPKALVSALQTDPSGSRSVRVDCGSKYAYKQVSTGIFAR